MVYSFGRSGAALAMRVEDVFVQLLRSAEARTVNALWTTMGALLDEFTATECAGYIPDRRRQA